MAETSMTTRRLKRNMIRNSMKVGITPKTHMTGISISQTGIISKSQTQLSSTLTEIQTPMKSSTKVGRTTEHPMISIGGPQLTTMKTSYLPATITETVLKIESISMKKRSQFPKERGCSENPKNRRDMLEKMMSMIEAGKRDTAGNNLKI